ncbi:MAG: hypothetical protein CMM56_03255, partial [Rhodospirillaceae bacterium]|nr:hypothetical protein [Rhodospirillaceae bacterium]
MSIYWQKIQIFSWFIFFILSLSSSKVFSQEIVNSLVERGRELYHAEPVGCWVCHGEEAQGRVGPTLEFGPT